MKLPVTLAFLAWAYHAQAKAVFAHFMVGNTAQFTQADWENNIGLAQAAHIDAFALNMAYGESTTDSQLPNAFAAAVAKGFSLFFSLDYAGNGLWPEADVISLMNKYISSSAYYHSSGKPFISTFEGPTDAADWVNIKAQTNCMFYPDWSSLGAKEALLAGGGGIVDGLFSWAAWPWGNTDMDTYGDASYGDFLDDVFGGDGSDLSHYMMPVSPWFYTNLPGYNKNWLWRGDSLWYDRWEQAIYIQPEFIEILTWNDFGESHYIGPLDDRQYDAFTIGKAPYNYVLDMPHDGWRVFLPYLIDTYKNNVSSITQEAIVAWYRPNPTSGSTCSTGGTSGNTHSQFQIEFEPGEVVQDNIFYSALLAGPGATVTVTIGGNTVVGGWAKTPFDGIGMYHGNVSMSGHTGAVTITLSRGGAVINGKDITTTCTDGIQNWNAWVGSAYGQTVATTPTSTTNQVCVAGTGTGNFLGLCAFTCSLGYCPIAACVCTQMGTQRTLPTSKNVVGYPAAGMSASYEGICNFACNYGYCPAGTCGLTKEPESTPTVSPFTPDACTGGSGDGNLGGLCGFACGYGYCPISSCSCTSRGAFGTLPAYTGDDSEAPIAGLDIAIYGDLCKFAIQYGYFPSDVCTKSSSTTGKIQVCISGTGPDNVGGLCDFACNHGFCPSPCTCLTYGSQVPLPSSTPTPGYPLAGEGDEYSSLCAFTCMYGYCPDTACSYSPPAGSGGIIYLPPSIWNISSGPVGCNGNSECTLIIPPSPLPAPETISWPALTTSVLSSSGGAIYTKTTVLSIPVFTITEVNFWSVTITVGDPAYATFQPKPSIMPPGIIVTLPGTEATFPPTPYPSYSNFVPVASSSSTTTPIPLFFSTSHGVSIQPMPTISINTPIPPTGTKTTIKTVITYSSSSSGSQATCTGSGCGTHDCGLFGCGIGCGIFGCGGGCGIFGCGGGCGLLGCGGGCGSPAGCGSTSCPLTNPACSNGGCVGGACPGGGLGEGEGVSEPESTSTCEPSTVTYTPCATTTVCPLKLKGRAPAPAAACATTTSCEAPKSTVGCNIDPETGEENDGFSILYVVYPKDGATSSGTDPLISLFKSYGSQSATGLTTATSTIIGIMFWTLHLTPDQVTELENNALVDSVTPQCTSCPNPFARIPRRKETPRNETFEEEFKNLDARELGLVRQSAALPQLVMVSQESGHTLAEYSSNYIYDSSEGTGTLVYVVDTYINSADEEFAKFKSQITSLDAGEGAPTPSTINKDPMQHGTCVLSMIASDTFGVSKNVVPVLIGMTSATLVDERFHPESILIGINLALQHYQNQGGSKKVGRAVINLSLGLSKAVVPAGWVNKCRILLQNLVSLGALPVVAAGNDGEDFVDKYPALFAASDIPQMLVVGSVNPAGVRSDFSNIDSFVTVHAPGEDTACSNGIGSSEVLEGTSMATGMVSGLAAYFSSLSSVTAALNAISPVSAQVAAWKTYIEDRTYQRAGGNVKAIWNGVPWIDEPLSCPLNPNGKRQEYEECSSSATTTAKATTTKATTTAAATPTSSYENSYNLYLWTCEGATEVIIYGAADSSGSKCDSQNSFLSNRGGLIIGDTFTVCNAKVTIGRVDPIVVTSPGQSGSCKKVSAGPSDIGSCLGQSGDIQGVGCLVELAYECNPPIC